MTIYRSRSKGFTLIEMAVVLVIVGLLLGSFIGTFASRIDTTRRDATEKELAEIKQMLIAFAYTKDPPYLPCPDTDVPPDGRENRNGANDCSAGINVGTLPWIDIGLGHADSWSTRYSYWVNINYARPAGFNLLTSELIGSSSVATRVNDVATGVAVNAVAVVYSRGKNGLGGVGTDNVSRVAIPAAGHDDENDNADANFNFIFRPSTDEGAATAGGIFDDILVWINSYELKAKMVETGVLP
ncbi:MAG: prepilin-type N-terminal cleavage/methylation domain-containing protein [Gammaproteobacteria bacterium]|nr:prepilin-type N-terminal cleavage/methylation domain-containing protein [Gammaproteobacteria bacterium]